MIITATRGLKCQLYTDDRYKVAVLRFTYLSTSIGEKLLSHWLALCMFNFSRGLPGEELYNLYSALKVQINKGPIDAVTGEAKYSLNQDNILRTTFEVKVNIYNSFCGDFLKFICSLNFDTMTLNSSLM